MSFKKLCVILIFTFSTLSSFAFLRVKRFKVNFGREEFIQINAAKVKFESENNENSAITIHLKDVAVVRRGVAHRVAISIGSEDDFLNRVCEGATEFYSNIAMTDGVAVKDIRKNITTITHPFNSPYGFTQDRHLLGRYGEVLVYSPEDDRELFRIVKRERKKGSVLTNNSLYFAKNISCVSKQKD